MSRKTKQTVLPRRPDRRRIENGAGISTWNEYLRDLEKWADAAEKRIKELEQSVQGAWVMGSTDIMISLELARKLKDAGLEWEPRACDAYYWASGVGDHPVLVMHNDSGLLKKEQNTKGIVWAPRLDQILAEIERRGYEYQLHYCRHDGHPDLLKYDCGLHRQIDDLNAITCFFVGHSADEAAAKALLWILRRERDAE